MNLTGFWNGIGSVASLRCQTSHEISPGYGRLSEIRKFDKGRAHQGFAAWFSGVTSTQFCVSVITLLESERGLLRLERYDPVQAGQLRHWIRTRLPDLLGNCILPVTARIARRCAELHVPASRPELDSLIAATALVHGLTVVTRNVRDFEGTGAALYDPWMSV